MRLLAWLVLAAWLAAGAHLAVRDGVGRVRKDAAIARVEGVTRRRGLAWDAGELGRHVASMERAALELGAEGHERVLLSTRPNTNPFISVAVHVLFPTHVLIRMREGHSLAEVREEARREGAGAILFLGPEGDWTSLPVTGDAGDAGDEGDGRGAESREGGSAATGDPAREDPDR